MVTNAFMDWQNGRIGKAEMKGDELVTWRIFAAEDVHLQRVR